MIGNAVGLNVSLVHVVSPFYPPVSLLQFPFCIDGLVTGYIFHSGSVFVCINANYFVELVVFLDKFLANDVSYADTDTVKRFALFI